MKTPDGKALIADFSLLKRNFSRLSNLGIGTLLGAALLTGCTRSEEASTQVSIQTPISLTVGESTRKIQMSGNENSPPWSGSINSRTEINCYLLFVGGPTATLRGNFCNARNSTNRVAEFGPLVGGIPAGQRLEINIPSGNGRVFYLLGMKANQGSCKNFMPDGPDSQQLSYPRLLSKVTVNLQGATQTVAMSVPADLTSLTEIDECQVRSIGGGNGGGGNPENLTQYFGDSRDGDVAFSSTDSGDVINTLPIKMNNGTHTAFPNSPIDGTKKFAASKKITDIDTLGKTLTLNPTFNSNDFQVGDEVLFHVTASHGTGEGGTGPDGGCGSSDLFAGAYGFRRVESVSAASLTLDSPISSTPASINRSKLGVMSTPRGGGSGNDFCSMQVVRVPSFGKISLSGSATVFMNISPAFDTHSGGILALRMKTLELSSSTSRLTIDASYSGFSRGNTAMYSGVGFGGQLSGASSVGITNAGAALNNSLAAGGAGYGNGGDAASYNGSAGKAPDYCMSSKCQMFRDRRALLGGGGGSGTASAGGSGGGVILLFVERITGTGKLELKANGAGAGSSGGGGGGGRILLISRNIDLPQSNLLTEAKGGGGTGSNGVGGGGETEVRTCLSQSSTIPLINLDISIGTGGSQQNAQAGRAEVVNVPSYCF
ncbi:MAG: hypothetical protein WCH11_00280 [Bdellovibrio sp.]